MRLKVSLTYRRRTSVESLRSGRDAETILSDWRLLRRVARDPARFDALIDGWVSRHVWGDFKGMSKEDLERIGSGDLLGVICRTGRLREYIDAMTDAVIAEWMEENQP